MSRFKPIVAVMLCYVMALPVFAQTPEIKGASYKGMFYRLTRDYLPTTVPVISLSLIHI